LHRTIRSVGRVSVRPFSPSLGYRLIGEVRRFPGISERPSGFGFQHHSRRANRAPVDWSSSSQALPLDSLADERLGRRCSAVFAFSCHAVFPRSLSSRGVRVNCGSSRKAGLYSPPSSEANRCWQNRSYHSRRTQTGFPSGASRLRLAGAGNQPLRTFPIGPAAGPDTSKKGNRR
jgi:hypothetical protein